MAESTVNPTLPLVVAHDAVKQFEDGTLALKSVELSIRRGEFVSIVGPSGCGKSTLLRMIAGLTETSSGSLLVEETAPVVARRSRGDVAFVFQDPTLLSWRTVERNVSLPLELKSHPAEERGAVVSAALEMVGLTEFRCSFPNQLSGGMRMRVSIARAIVTEPGLLLMDEPFGSLDEISRQRLNEEISELWQRDRWTGLFVTHNVAEAVFLSQRVLVMSPRPGRLVADIAVPFEYPRAPTLRTDARFNEIAKRVARALHEAQS